MRTIVSTAVGCLVASLAVAALDASAAIAPLPAGQIGGAQAVAAGNFALAFAAPSGAAFAVTRDATPIIVARGGADDPAGHNAGDDRGRGRGKDNAVMRQRQGADDPAGHNAGDDKGRGRGKDDPPNHG
jgi:hypothetical protein